MLALLSAAAVFTSGCGLPARRADSPPPQVFTLRAEALERARDRVRAGDPELRPALDALIAEAEEALRVGPFSVTHKRKVPPSGDKRDYMSFGSYWWPNPETPDGLPYVRRDGEKNPEMYEDFDYPRLVALQNAVTTLGAAYYFTGEERYAERAATLLRVWFLDPDTRMNPHLEYGQAIPGRRPEGRFIGIIDTGDIHELINAVGLIERSEHWDEEDQRELQAWFRSYLEWLVQSEKGQQERAMHNNHGTYWDVQAASMALFVGDTTLARQILEESREKRIAQHIDSEGKQPRELIRTRSMHYSIKNLEGLAALAEMGRHVGVDLWGYQSAEGASIRQALDYLTVYADPSEEWPHQQLDGFDRSELLPLLRMGAAAYRDPRFESRIERIPEQNRVATHRVQLLYPPLH